MVNKETDWGGVSLILEPKFDCGYNPITAIELDSDQKGKFKYIYK